MEPPFLVTHYYLKPDRKDAGDERREVAVLMMVCARRKYSASMMQIVRIYSRVNPLLSTFISALLKK